MKGIILLSIPIVIIIIYSNLSFVSAYDIQPDHKDDISYIHKMDNPYTYYDSVEWQEIKTKSSARVKVKLANYNSLAHMIESELDNYNLTHVVIRDDNNIICIFIKKE